MDVVRYVLCFSVIIYHSFGILGLPTDFWPTSALSVGGFFALSGFLMFPSFEKRPVMRHYISRRAWRIMPSYIFVVIACAFGMVFFSNLSPIDYFLNIGFVEYLVANLSFLNFLHPDLPGVFDGSPINGSLWTMKGEWISYLSVPLVFKFIERSGGKYVLVFMLLIAGCLMSGCVFDYLYVTTDKQLYNTIAKQFNGILVYFYAGGLINCLWPLIYKYRRMILTISLASIIINYIFPTLVFNTFIYPIIFSLIVLIVSLWGDWGHRIAHHDNVSYEMYLFHLPIVFILVFEFPWIRTVSPWILVVFVTIVTYLVAFVVNRVYLILRGRYDKIN